MIHSHMVRYGSFVPTRSTEIRGSRELRDNRPPPPRASHSRSLFPLRVLQNREAVSSLFRSAVEKVKGIYISRIYISIPGLKETK